MRGPADFLQESRRVLSVRRLRFPKRARGLDRGVGSLPSALMSARAIGDDDEDFLAVGTCPRIAVVLLFRLRAGTLREGDLPGHGSDGLR
jgi:hypothetical protein